MYCPSDTLVCVLMLIAIFLLVMDLLQEITNELMLSILELPLIN